MPDRFQLLEAQLEQCLLRDRARFRERLAALRKASRHRNGVSETLEDIDRQIQASLGISQSRRDATPNITYPPALPVAAAIEDIKALICAHQVVIFCGETGSGKTTQIPKLCLELGYAQFGMIGHTQPRRVAATSVAHRIANELDVPLGREVGYKIRFNDRSHADSLIKVMTDGILLAETRSDPLLSDYSVLIIDEAHERSLNIDFLLGYMHRLLPKRPDLKLVITSATIDTEKFSRHFSGAPILEVSGQTFPVEVRYRVNHRPQDHDGRTQEDLQSAILESVDELWREGPGDIMVFLPGERDIRETAAYLRKHLGQDAEILPLYARLSHSEQQKVFLPHDRLRIVLATNVAETSLTVPGIRYVIDSGVARISRYSYRSKVQRLLIEKISQASARQRTGRCGRTGAGICIRLYSEDDFLSRPTFTDPEILRTNLAGVILQMMVWGLGDIEEFPFVDPPDRRYVNDGHKLLFELGAIDGARQLTETGRRMARLPIDPRTARMVIASIDAHCVKEVLIIAAALSIQDPRTYPAENRDAAQEIHRVYADPRSDFLAYLILWEQFSRHYRSLSRSKFKQYCKDHLLSLRRLLEWRDLHSQLHQHIAEMGVRLNQIDAGYNEIHAALLHGLIGHVAKKTDRRLYEGVRGIQVMVHPSSTLDPQRPKWIMAAELVDTGRLYARTVAMIDPRSIEQVGKHLMKEHVFGAHWDDSGQQVTAYRKTTLYGLVINPRQRVSYGQIAPQDAREIFLRSALAEGGLATEGAFLGHNLQVLEEVASLEEKLRRRDHANVIETCYRFYAERLPAGIFSLRQFERWRVKAEETTPRILYMDAEAFYSEGQRDIVRRGFPDHLEIGDARYELSYRFAPGEPDDGVAIRVPLVALPRVPESLLVWLVPGLLEEKVTALIRTLPKQQRRLLVPGREFAHRCVARMRWGAGDLLEALASELTHLSGSDVSPDDFDPECLPEHLKMTVTVLDASGQTLRQGKRLLELKDMLSADSAKELERFSRRYYPDQEYRSWEFGELPTRIEVSDQGLSIQAYPAVVDRGNAVGLQLFSSGAEAARQHRRGLHRLYRLRSGAKIKALEKRIKEFPKLGIYYLAIGDPETMVEALITLIVDAALCPEAALPRDPSDFLHACVAADRCLLDKANHYCQLLQDILARYRVVQGQLRHWEHRTETSLVDMREQLHKLIYHGFIDQTPPAWLVHFPRYLEGLEIRIRRWEDDPQRDEERLRQLRPMWETIWEKYRHKDGGKALSAALLTGRWWLEEWRISLFAQQLKTAIPVSLKRIQGLLQ